MDDYPGATGGPEPDPRPSAPHPPRECAYICPMANTSPRRGVSAHQQPYRLIFDGDCRLCRRYAAWMAQRDRLHVMRATPYQAAALGAPLRARAERSLLLIHPDGRWEERARAVLRGLILTGSGQARWLRLPPLIYLADLAYCWVARRRAWVGRWLARRERWSSRFFAGFPG